MMMLTDMKGNLRYIEYVENLGAVAAVRSGGSGDTKTKGDKR